jgi:outer membrane receptor protein involved in Fe transport
MLSLLLALALAQSAVTGVVKDTSGGVVSGATVIVRSDSGERRTVTGPDGRFTIGDAPDNATIIVRAGGFAEKRQPLTSRELEIILTPAAILETVTVTPTRSEQRLGTIPASVSVVDAEQIRQSPALVADDVLRQVPTFSLFRRSSSLSAQPTTQGVSLRGIGPSGVSRTLVLLDGVPFNDPFGGWVYWTRVPLENLDRVEVVEGPNSSLYGNYAMGGVINLVSSPAARRTIELRPQYSSLGSPKFDAFGSDLWGKVAISGQASVFDTDGFVNVARSERGPVDVDADVTFRHFSVKADYAPSSRVRAFGRVGYFREERNNGKVTTIDATPTPEANDTTWTAVNGGVRLELPDSSGLEASVFADVPTFHANFLAVPNLVTRAIARVTLDQRVPTHAAGGALQWSKALTANNQLTVGGDFRWIDGDSQESVFDPVVGRTQTLFRVSGGTQRSQGFFVQDILTPVPQVTITAAARVDRWRNYDAHNLETSLPSGAPGAGHNPKLPGRDDTVVSPRLGVMYRVSDQVNVWSSYSHGFRAPTLNELYRQFRVGAILTQANFDLGPERLKGGEIGVNLLPLPSLTIRSTYFDNRIRNPIGNVTLTANTRQRQNLGRTQVRGVQFDGDYRLGSDWRVAAAYVYGDARVREYNPTPAPAISLVDKFIAQVPKHRGSVRLTYANPRVVTILVDVEGTGRQYEDDQNLLTVPAAALRDAGYAVTGEPGLPAFGIVNVSASRTVAEGIEVYVGAQNLFDKEFFVGLAPTTIGAPRMVSVGARIRFAAR